MNEEKYICKCVVSHQECRYLMELSVDFKVNLESIVDFALDTYRHNQKSKNFIYDDDGNKIITLQKTYDYARNKCEAQIKFKERYAND